MRFNDFEYDGISLSSMGLGIVSFDGMQDGDITTDSQKTFNSISLFGGRYQPFIVTTYEDRLEIEFSIAKNYCTEFDDYYFSIYEIENIQYWLNRSTPHKFRILEDVEYADVYWEGSFNIQWVKIGENTIGFNATFASNRPYAIGNETLYEKELGGNVELVLADFSYDEGSIIPTVVIELKEDGDLKFINTFNDVETITEIKGCVSGEIITFDKLMQVSSSIESHDIYNNFNWVFPRIYNVYGNTINKYKSNLNCDCKITYNPVRKVTFS